MNIKISRIDKSLPLPEYHSDGAVAFDLYSRETVTIQPRSMSRMPTNFIIEVPKGFMLFIKERSSLLKKTGLLMTPGFIDQDYCGPEDEILLQVYNPSDESVTIERGMRIAQGAFMPIEIAVFKEVGLIKSTSRGGFGSTGQ